MYGKKSLLMEKVMKITKQIDALGLAPHQKGNTVENSFKKIFLTILTALIALALPMASQAKDILEAKINLNTPDNALLTHSAPTVDLSQGAYTSSTNTQIMYIVIANEFPTGPFGSFDLGLQIVADESNPATDYPIDVTIAQEGEPAEKNLRLTPNLGTFINIEEFGTVGSATVQLSIQCGGAAPSCPSIDGSEIVANLKFSSNRYDGKGSPHLTDNVKVKVVIKLVHPSTQCLNLYSFVTDQSLTVPVNSTDVVAIKQGRNAGRVNTTTPFGQHSYNVLVVNTCVDFDSFDLKITLDSSYQTNPNNNPGNAVFTYLAENSVYPVDFDIDIFSVSTPQGQTLCLQDILLDGGQTFLATVHMGIERGIDLSQLPSDPEEFKFTAELYEAGEGCGSSAWTIDTSYVSYTIK
jgi:hypothetical protein